MELYTIQNKKPPLVTRAVNIFELKTISYTPFGVSLIQFKNSN